MSNITNVIDESTADTNKNAEYQLWALLVMQSLMLLERILKNSKLFCRCNKDGCTLTNRTPPLSPSQSQSVKREKGSGEDKVDMDDVIKALDKIRESQKSISNDSTSEAPKWKRKKAVIKPEEEV